MIKSKISAISYFYPESKLTNKDLRQCFPEYSEDKIANKTGIYTRYISGDNEYSLELAEQAGKKLFLEHQLDPKEIDYLIVCTQTPKYLIPTSACILQDRLGLRQDTGGFDLNMGCSGYIYCLHLTHCLIQSGQAEKILLLTTDTYTKLVDKENRQLRTIFGDGAAATLIEASSIGIGINNFCFYTDGSGYDKLIAPMSGVQGLASNHTYSPDLEMAGTDVFSFAITVVPSIVDRILAKCQFEKSDIGYCVCHQANEYMLSYIKKKLEFNDSQFIIDLAEGGNTVSSSIPIVLSKLYRKEPKNKETVQLLVGFGVGLSCAACILS